MADAARESAAEAEPDWRLSAQDIGEDKARMTEGERAVEGISKHIE